MQVRFHALAALAVASILAVGGAARAADQAAVDKAFDALKTYDYGQNRDQLNPIDDAVVAAHGDAAALKALEVRLAAVLKTDAPRDAKDYCCRVLRIIGTAESVPTLAALLSDKDLSHMARFALQSIPAPEAGAALRDALPKLSGQLRIGVIASLGARHDAESVTALVALVSDTDPATAAAAAESLGTIGTPEAAKALGDAVKTAPAAIKPDVTDAYLVCAERRLAEGDKAGATTIYKSLNAEDQPKQVRVAAARGLLAIAGKKD